MVECCRRGNQDGRPEAGEIQHCGGGQAAVASYSMCLKKGRLLGFPTASLWGEWAPKFPRPRTRSARELWGRNFHGSVSPRPMVWRVTLRGDSGGSYSITPLRMGDLESSERGFESSTDMSGPFQSALFKVTVRDILSLTDTETISSVFQTSRGFHAYVQDNASL